MKLARSAPFVLAAVGLLLCLSGCGHVGFVNNERPGLTGTNPAAASAPRPDDPDDEEGDEPEHPLVDTKQERAMVHVHAKEHACVGVIVGPRVVATSRRCLRQAQGVHPLEKQDVRVEVPSSSLTWTQRAGSHVLVPGCERRDLDVAVVVLAEGTPWVEPLGLASAPGPGATVEAIGFDKCEGAKEVKRAHVVDRAGAEIVLDRGMCRGDAGGPVIDTAGGTLVGIQSRRKGGRSSPRKETTVTRFDTGPVRELFAQAKVIADGGDPAVMKPVACAVH